MEPAVCDTGADFSPCGRYRYRLWRRWDAGPVAVWLLLNPSTADATVNDATIERCQRRSARWGYGALVVVNLFALRATRPRELYRHPDPVGPDNDGVILEAATRADHVICGWGNHGLLGARGQRIVRVLSEHGCELRCLGVTARGQPHHPLFVPYATPLQNMSL